MKTSLLCYTEVVFVSQSSQNFDSLTHQLTALSIKPPVYIADYGDFFKYRSLTPILAICDVDGLTKAEIRQLKKMIAAHTDLFILICEPSVVSLVTDVILHPNVVKVVKPFYPYELHGAASLVAEQFIYYQSERIKTTRELISLKQEKLKLQNVLAKLEYLQSCDNDFSAADIHLLCDRFAHLLMQLPETVCAGILLFGENNELLQCAMTDLSVPDKINRNTEAGHENDALQYLQGESQFTQIKTQAQIAVCKAYLHINTEIQALMSVSVALDDNRRCFLYIGRDQAANAFDELDRSYLNQLSNSIKKNINYLQLQQWVNANQQRLHSLQNKNNHLQESLAEVQAQLLQSEKMASLGQLTAGVAHEINNPIGYVKSNFSSLDTYVSGLFSLLGVYEKSEEAIADQAMVAAIRNCKHEIDFDYIKKDVRELIKESAEGIERVKRIVKDLKDFSHTNEDNWEYVDIHTGLESTLNIVKNEIKYKANLICNYASLPPVKCIISQLNQVFMNMLINASQAIDKYGEIRIETGVDDNKQIWVRFSDSGRGIKQAQLTKLFEPFFTTKPVGQGTGLGLSISRDIVSKHGGEIVVDSVEGKGSSFTIFLPINGQKSEANLDESVRQAS